MKGPRPWKRLIETFSVRELEGLIEAKRLLKKREELQDKMTAQKRALRETKREIRKVERAVARAVKARRAGRRAGRKPGPKPGLRIGARKGPQGPRKGRRGLRKGRLLGLRPTSLAYRVHDYIARTPGKQARVSEIAAAMKGWKGRTDARQMLRHVAATLSKRSAYFRKVERGVYTVAGKA